MEPTQKQDNTGPHYPAFGENFLSDLFTDNDRFLAWVATANGTAAQPTNQAGEVRFDITEAGRKLLDEAPASTGDDEPSAFVAVRGWCEQCGQALPWVCSWDEHLCSDCVVVIPAADGEEPEILGVPAGQVLRDAALYLERHGWIQGEYYDGTTGSFTPAACMVGAIAMVCYGGPVDAPAQMFDDPGFLEFEAAVLHLDRYLLVEDGSESYGFNDYRGRTLETVTHVLRDAAARPVEELLDAMRAIETHDANMAALRQLLTPTGIWADERFAPVGEIDECDSDCDGGETNFVDCQFCGAPGGYPDCQGTANGRMSCAEVVAADDAELAARDGDSE